MRSIRACLILVSLITGCSQNDNDATNTAISSIDSCSLVLAEHHGGEQSMTITKYQAAIKQNIQTISNLEKLGWAYVDQARNQYDQGYYNLALNAAKCIKQKGAHSAAADFLKAYVLHQLHQFKQAEGIANNLVQNHGRWYEYALLGDVLMEQGKLIQAQQAYQQMMDIRPGPEAYARAAHLRWLTGDLDGAIDLMQMAGGAVRAKNKQWAWLNTRLGYYLFNAKSFSRAQSLVNQVLLSHENYAPALFLQGQLSLANDNIEKAISDFQLAINIHPLPEYLWALADALDAISKSEQAEKIKTQLNQTANTQDPRTYSLFLASTNHLPQIALSLARNEITERQDLFTHDALAWSLFKNDELQRAVKHTNIAVSNDTPHARLFYHCALINSHAGQTVQARYCFEKANKHKHMLLPSERSQLKSEFEQFLSQQSFFETMISLNNEHFYIIRRKT